MLLKLHLDVKQTDLWLFRNNVNYLLETTQDALENNPFYLLNGQSAFFYVQCLGLYATDI